AERAPADARSRPAGALLAHADRVAHLPADAEVLLADVVRLLDTLGLRRLRAAVGPGRARRGRTHPVDLAAAPSRARAARYPREPRGGAARRLRDRVHRRATRGDQPADLVRHPAARPDLRDLGGLLLRRSLDPARPSPVPHTR